MYGRHFLSECCRRPVGAALRLQRSAQLVRTGWWTPGNISCWCAAHSPDVVLEHISRRSGFELGSLQEGQKLLVLLVALVK